MITCLVRVVKSGLTIGELMHQKLQKIWSAVAHRKDSIPLKDNVRPIISFIAAKIERIRCRNFSFPSVLWSLQQPTDSFSGALKDTANRTTSKLPLSFLSVLLIQIFGVVQYTYLSNINNPALMLMVLFYWIKLIFYQVMAFQNEAFKNAHVFSSNRSCDYRNTKTYQQHAVAICWQMFP